MKILLALFLATFTILSSQDLKYKIPPTAQMVTEFSGSEIEKNLSYSGLDSYDFVQEILKDEKLNSTADIGFDLNRNHYQYLQATDTIAHYVMLFALDETGNFEKFFDKVNRKNDQFEENGEALNFKYYVEGDEVFYGWNQQTLAIVFPIYEYIDKTPPPHKKTSVTEDAAEEATETEDNVDTEINTPEEDPFFRPEDYKSKWQIEREIELKVKTETSFEILSQVFGTKTYKNQKLFAHKESNSSFYAWADYASLMNLYYQTIGLMGMRSYAYDFPFYNYLFDPKNEFLGPSQQYELSINGFIEKEQLKAVTKMIPKNEETKQALGSLYGSKMNKNLIQYIDRDALGTFTISFNSEALIHQYYDIMRSQLKIYGAAATKSKTDNDVFDVFVDGLEILFDEKAIADIAPGNAVFTLNSIQEKTVEYTTYEYDDDYNRTEVTGTKTEPIPEFTIAIETRNPKFLSKLLRLPKSFNELKIFSTDVVNEVYKTEFKDSYLPEIYYTVKNDVLVFGTSEKVVKGKAKQPKRKIRKSIENNNSFFHFNLNQFVQNMESEFIDKEDVEDRDGFQILKENLGEFNGIAHVENGNLVSEFVYQTKGNHKNALQYFFNLGNQFYLLDKKHQKSRAEIKEEVEAAIEAVEEDVVKEKMDITPPPPPPPPAPVRIDDEEIYEVEEVEEEESLPEPVYPEKKPLPLKLNVKKK